jgi:filamentous hemagglutinin
LKESAGKTPDLKSVVEPNAKANDTLKNPPKPVWSDPNYDCSEIAEDIYDATGEKGMIIDIRPSGPVSINNEVRIPMAEGRIDTFYYHQVYSDGRYVFDPRLSSEPIPLSEYIQVIQALNPGVLINSITP